MQPSVLLKVQRKFFAICQQYFYNLKCDPIFQQKNIADAIKELNDQTAATAKKDSALAAMAADLEAKSKKLADDTSSLTSREAAFVNREKTANTKAAEVAELETLIKELPAFDPNNSTEAAMILTYKLPAQTRRDLIAMQRTAYQKYSANRVTQALEDYTKAFEAAPEANYLAAYWAGLSAERIRNKREEALTWANRALEINPDYKPAQELKRRLEARNAPAQRRRTK